jgi:hypothetical protein
VAPGARGKVKVVHASGLGQGHQALVLSVVSALISIILSRSLPADSIGATGFNCRAKGSSVLLLEPPAARGEEPCRRILATTAILEYRRRRYCLTFRVVASNSSLRERPSNV